MMIIIVFNRRRRKKTQQGVELNSNIIHPVQLSSNLNDSSFTAILFFYQEVTSERSSRFSVILMIKIQSEKKTGMRQLISHRIEERSLEIRD